jgi:hypothetical protein
MLCNLWNGGEMKIRCDQQQSNINRRAEQSRFPIGDCVMTDLLKGDSKSGSKGTFRTYPVNKKHGRRFLGCPLLSKEQMF